MYHVSDADDEVLILTVLHAARQLGGFGSE